MIEQFNMPETVFERPTTLRSVLRYWYVVLISAVLGAACGGVYAFKRPPVYTATARLSAISVTTSNAASLAGSLEAGQELASTFARVVQSSQVANAVAGALHTTPEWAAAHVERDTGSHQPVRDDQRECLEPRHRQDSCECGPQVGGPVRAQPPQRVIERTGDAGQDP